MKKSHILVIVQFALIFAIALYCGVLGNWWQNLLTIISFCLGVWAVYTMHFAVSISPEIRQKQQLFTGGPYRFIRHPMYLAVLLATAVWVGNNFSFISVGLWALLLVDLLIKLHYEERLLTKHFADYKKYTKHTKKLVPFVY